MQVMRIVGVLLVAAAVRPVQAQAPAVTVGGVGYAHYVYQLRDTLNHVNNFDVARAYINVNGRFDRVTTRVTPDIYRVADGSLAYRLKYAYVTYQTPGSPLTFKFGQMQTAWVDFEENLWDYRMQGNIALERGDLLAPLAYVSSSDFGIGVDGKWGPDNVNGQVVLINGENYNRAPGGKQKDLQARVSIRVMKTDDSSRTGGLRLSAYGQYGKPTSSGIRNRALGMISYRSKVVTLAAEAAVTRDSVTAPVLTKRSGRLIGAFAVVRVPNSKAGIIARIDLMDPNTATPNNRQTRIIAGASYQLTPNLRTLLDLDHVSYEGGITTPALEAVRSQALFQVQFTF